MSIKIGHILIDFIATIKKSVSVFLSDFLLKSETITKTFKIWLKVDLIALAYSGLIVY